MISEKQRTPFPKRACSVLIVVALVCVVIFFALSVPRQPQEPIAIKVNTLPDEKKATASLPRPARLRGRGTRTPRPIFDSEAYYRPILEYNLFRPLGWKPARPQEPYRLIGTLIPTDSNTPPKALLLKTATGTTHIVPLGDPLDANTTVTAIESKQVILETSGQQRTLRLNTSLWLNASSTNRSLLREQPPAPMRGEIPTPTTVTAKPTRTDQDTGLSKQLTIENISISSGDMGPSTMTIDVETNQ